MKTPNKVQTVAVAASLAFACNLESIDDAERENAENASAGAGSSGATSNGGSASGAAGYGAAPAASGASGAPVVDAGNGASDDGGPIGNATEADGGSALSGLDGAAVTFGVHCCEDPPSNATRISELLSGTVGATVEFQAIGGSARPGFIVADADVDIANRSIDVIYRQTLELPNVANTGFNGYVFDFSGDDLPAITSATLDSDTTAEFQDMLTVTFDADSVLVNARGLIGSRGVFPGDQISVQLSF